jgi:hypothetical protein
LTRFLSCYWAITAADQAAGLWGTGSHPQSRATSGSQIHAHSSQKSWGVTSWWGASLQKGLYCVGVWLTSVPYLYPRLHPSLPLLPLVGRFSCDIPSLPSLALASFHSTHHSELHFHFSVCPSCHKETPPAEQLIHNTHLWLTVSEPGKFKMKVTVDSVSGEDFILYGRWNLTVSLYGSFLTGHWY